MVKKVKGEPSGNSIETLTLVQLVYNLVTGLGPSVYESHIPKFVKDIEGQKFSKIQKKEIWKRVPKSLLKLLKSLLEQKSLAPNELHDFLTDSFF
jgi:hypothetical protein